MVATPEALTGQVLQDTRAICLSLLEGVQPRIDWLRLVAKSVLTVGIAPLVDLIGERMGSDRLTVWEECCKRDLVRTIEVDGKPQKVTLASQGVGAAVDAKVIGVILEHEEAFLVFERKNPVMKRFQAIPRAGIMEVKFGTPNLTQARHFREVVDRLKELQAA